MHEALLWLMLTLFSRCLSLPGELDVISADRSVAHADRAMEFLDQTELASSYGIIKQLVVSLTYDQKLKILSSHH